MTKTSGQFDMPVVRKEPELKKIRQTPKREVFTNDLLNRTQHRKKSPIKHVKNWGIQTMPQLNEVAHKQPVKWSSLVGIALTFALFTSSIHAISYLDSARSTTGLVLGSATTAYEELDAASQSLSENDFASAKNKFTAAQASLAEAQTALDKFRLLTLVAPQAQSADSVLTGAYFLAEAGKNLSSAMQLFDELSVNSEGVSTENFTNKLAENKKKLTNGLVLLGYAREQFNKSDNLPVAYEETVAHALQQISTLESVLKELVDLEDLYLSFFGSEPKTYLLAFQNYDEIRGTGGFVGTYGILKYENGSIKKLKVESVYNLDGSLTDHIAAPGPFQPEIKKWALRDANWFADFPKSATKLLEFFEREAETADGVIALTPKVFSDILNLIGPIPMDAYGVVLNAENFQDVVQTQTSINYDKSLNQPKKFLDDFAPLMLDRLSNLEREQWLEFFQLLKNNFLEKHVLVYSTEQNTQNKITKLGYDGRLLTAEHDYLSVIHSNLGGTKTDLDIDQSIDYKSEIGNDGRIVNTVTITRQNNAPESNLSFVRVLVPLGSKLLESHEFLDKPQFQSTAEGYGTDPDLALWDVGEKQGNVVIRTESGKTEYTGWIQTNALTSSSTTIKYLLPIEISLGLFNSTQPHSLVFQKQPGSLKTAVTGSWVLSGLRTKWLSNGLSARDNLLTFTSTGELDGYWGMVLSR
jgi:hypothetical protein